MVHELSHRAQVFQIVDGVDRPGDGGRRQHAVRIGAEFALDLGARQRVLGRAARMLAAGRERRAVASRSRPPPARRSAPHPDGSRSARPRRAAASDRRSGRARTGRASAPGRAGSPPRCNGRKSARRTSPCSCASLPCRSNTGWLNATRTFFTLAGSILCCSTRSNSAVFMPWIDEADGHRRSAICSSSQRLPRSAVTASGRPPFE